MTPREQLEVYALIIELTGMAKNDPNVNNEHAHCWLGKAQRPRTIEIGARLDEIGGFSLMYGVFEIVRQEIEKWGEVDNVGSLMRMLDMAWDGVGEWRG
jgi:hypothetical protein